MKNQYKTIYKKDRRRFLKGSILSLGSAVFSMPLFSFFSGTAVNSSEEAKKDHMIKQDQKLGIALVGLGQYSANQLAPALQETENCYLAGIVTGTPAKAEVWKEKYNIPDRNIYNYDNFDEIINNEDIDIIYVVLPNGLHAEYTIRAARAKKHVICEKPMATSVEDAQRMLDACRENGVKLAIGYRLHFEPFNRRVMELGQQQIYGKVQRIEAADSGDMTGGNLDVWRLDKELAGGGPLMDLGIYCVQGGIYTIGKKPVAVTANFGEITEPKYFYDVEQSINWEMEFEDGVKAECRSSYSENENLLFGEAENGWWRLNPAYSYDGKQGETIEGKMDLPNVYEQVRQMDGQAESFRKKKDSIVPGEMGLRDMKILMAIYESARNRGEKVEISY